MKKDDRIPYVYFIKNITTGLKYIGAKYSKKSDPKNFWVTYFTSSSLVKKFIDVYGKDDFEYKILKIFDSEFETLRYERKLLNIAVHRKDYLNLHYNFVSENVNDYELEKEKMFKVRRFHGMLSYTNKLGFYKLTEHEKLDVCSKGGKAAKIVNKLNGTGMYSEEVRRKMHETLRNKQSSAYYDPLLRYEICKKGGDHGLFSKHYADKNGISDEEMRKKQSERGKRGGIKNKGAKWYNDGVKLYKYTPNQMKVLSFNDFILQNPQYSKGRGQIIRIKRK
jgi:hypothetical protein